APWSYSGSTCGQSDCSAGIACLPTGSSNREQYRYTQNWSGCQHLRHQPRPWCQLYCCLCLLCCPQRGGDWRCACQQPAPATCYCRCHCRRAARNQRHSHQGDCAFAACAGAGDRGAGHV
ncbi:hypothetical protein GGH99_006421, partial [Coemansia sp. RSA 1285]